MVRLSKTLVEEVRNCTGPNGPCGRGVVNTTGDHVGVDLPGSVGPQDYVPRIAGRPPLSAKRVNPTSAGKTRSKAKLVP